MKGKHNLAFLMHVDVIMHATVWAQVSTQNEQPYLWLCQLRPAGMQMLLSALNARAHFNVHAYVEWDNTCIPLLGRMVGNFNTTHVIFGNFLGQRQG